MMFALRKNIVKMQQLPLHKMVMYFDYDTYAVFSFH